MSSSVSLHGSNINPASVPIYHQGIYTPTLQKIPINQSAKFFDQNEFARLVNILNSKVNVNHAVEFTFFEFLIYFVKEIETSFRSEIFTEIDLKGGALNHLIVGDTYLYADLDFTFFVNEVDFTNLKNCIDHWLNTRLKIREKSNLVTLPNAQFLLITLPALPKPIDIQIITLKASQSIRSSTHSFNALRCPLYNFLKCLIHKANLPQPYFYPLDGFTVEECILDIQERRSRVNNPLEVHEGLRSHCYLLSKDVIPRTLSYETFFCLGLQRDYENLKDGFLRFENLLYQFIYRHYQSDIASTTIFLLNYARIIIFSGLANKEEIMRTLTGILIRNLGLKSKSLNIQECSQIIAVCFDYFSTYYDKQISQLHLEMPLKKLTLNSGLTTLVFCETNNWGVNPEFFDSELKFRLINKLEMLFPKPVQIAIPTVEPLKEETPAQSSASQVENEPSSLPQIQEDPASIPQIEIKPLSLNDEIDLFCKNALKDPVDEEDTIALEMLSKIKKSLNLERKKNLGLAIQKIVKELITKNKHHFAFKIYVEALSKIGLEYLEDLTSKNPLTISTLLKAHVALENTIENQDLLFNFYLRMSESTNKSSGKLLPKNAQVLFDYIVQWVENNLQNKKPESYIQIAKTVMHFLLDSSSRLDESYKKIVREKCIDVFMKNPHSTHFIDLAWGYSLPNSQVETNKFWTKTSQYLIESLSKYPAQVAMELALKLFNSLSQVKSRDQFVYDISFLELIKKLGDKFYLSISDEVEKYPYDRFLAYLKVLLSLKDIPIELEDHLVNAFKRIEQEFKNKKDIQVVVTDLFPKPVLEKFPKLKELHSQLFKERDAFDFAKELIKVVPAFEKHIVGLKGDSDFYSNLHRCFRLEVSSYRNPLEPKDLASINESCKNELNRLINLKKQNTEKWAKPLSELVQFNIFIYIVFTSEDCFNANIKSVQSLIKRAVLSNWLLLEEFKLCLVYYMQLAKADDRKALLNILKDGSANEIQLFYYFVYEIEVNILKPEGLKLVGSQIESLEKHYPVNKAYINDAFDIIMKAFHHCLHYLKGTDPKDERRLDFFNSVLSLPLEKKQFKEWVKLQNAPEVQTDFIAQTQSLVSAFNKEDFKGKNIAKLDVQISLEVSKGQNPITIQVQRQSKEDSKVKGCLTSQDPHVLVRNFIRSLQDITKILKGNFSNPQAYLQLVQQITMESNQRIDSITKSYNENRLDPKAFLQFTQYLADESKKYLNPLESAVDDDLLQNFTSLILNSEDCERMRHALVPKHNPVSTEQALKSLSVVISNNYRSLLSYVLKRSHEPQVHKLIICLVECYNRLRHGFPDSKEHQEILKPYILLENISKIPEDKLKNELFFTSIAKGHHLLGNYSEVLLHNEYLLSKTNDSEPFLQFSLLEPLLLSCIKLKNWSKAKGYASEILELFHYRLYTKPISGKTPRPVAYPTIFQGITEDILRLQFKVDRFKDNQPDIEVDSIKSIDDLISSYNPKISAKAYALKIMSFYEAKPDLELYYHDEICYGVVIWELIRQLIQSNELLIAANLFLTSILNQNYNKMLDFTAEFHYIDAKIVDLILRNPEHSKELIEKAFQIGARMAWKNTQNQTAIVISSYSKGEEFVILRDLALINEWEMVNKKCNENKERYHNILAELTSTRLMINLITLYSISKPENIGKVLQQIDAFYQYLQTNKMWEKLTNYYSEFDIPNLIKLKRLFLELHECLQSGEYEQLEIKLNTFLSEPFRYFFNKENTAEYFVTVFANGFIKNYFTFIQNLINEIKKIPEKDSIKLRTYPTLMIQKSSQTFRDLDKWVKTSKDNKDLFNQVKEQSVLIYPTTAKNQSQKATLMLVQKLMTSHAQNDPIIFEKLQTDVDRLLSVDNYSYVDTEFLADCDVKFQDAKKVLIKGAKLFSENNSPNVNPKTLLECISLFQKVVSVFEFIVHNIKTYSSKNCNDYFKGYLLMYMQNIEKLTVEAYFFLEKLYVTPTLEERILPEEEYKKGLYFLTELYKLSKTPSLAYTIGCCLSATNRFDEALAYLRKGDLEDVTALKKLISLCIIKDYQDEAIKYFETHDSRVKIYDKEILQSISNFYKYRNNNDKAEILLKRASE